MPNVVGIAVHYRTKDDQSEVIEENVQSQDITDIKVQVAKIVRDLRQAGTNLYFYVVLKARKSDGTFGYRTIIPKTFFNVEEL